MRVCEVAALWGALLIVLSVSAYGQDLSPERQALANLSARAYEVRLETLGVPNSTWELLFAEIARPENRAIQTEAYAELCSYTSGHFYVCTRIAPLFIQLNADVRNDVLLTISGMERCHPEYADTYQAILKTMEQYLSLTPEEAEQKYGDASLTETAVSVVLAEYRCSRDEGALDAILKFYSQYQDREPHDAFLLDLVKEWLGVFLEGAPKDHRRRIKRALSAN